MTQRSAAFVSVDGLLSPAEIASDAQILGQNLKDEDASMTNEIGSSSLNKNTRWIPMRMSGPYCLLPTGLSSRVLYKRALEWLAVFDQADTRRLIGIEMLWESLSRGYAAAGLELAEQRNVHAFDDDPTGLTRCDAAQILAAWALKGYVSSAKDIHFYYADVFSNEAMAEIFSSVKTHDDWCHDTWLFYSSRSEGLTAE